MIIYILLGIFILMQVIDGITTYKAITSKVGTEANVVMKFIFNKVGLIPGILLTKIPVIGFLTYLSQFPFMVYIYGVLCLVYLLVIINNLKVINEDT